MRKFALLIILAVLPACVCVETDVVDSISVLNDNTVSLSVSYSALLERSDHAPLVVNPEWTPEELAEAEASADAEWAEHVEHQLMLMSANNTLAERVLTWARVKNDAPDENDEETTP